MPLAKASCSPQIATAVAYIKMLSLAPAIRLLMPKNIPESIIEPLRLQRSAIIPDGISARVQDIKITTVIKLIPKLSIPILLRNNFSIEYQSTKLKKNLPIYSGSSLFATALFMIFLLYSFWRSLALFSCDMLE